jgi:phage tail P2-like protein
MTLEIGRTGLYILLGTQGADRVWSGETWLDDVIQDAGDLVLPESEEPLIRALSDADGRAMLGVPADLIVENWDPAKVQERNLPYLQWALNTNLWDDAWPLAQKRAWLAAQWEFKARRGTKRAMTMALDQFGFDLVQVVAPPQGFYAAEFEADPDPMTGSHWSYSDVDRVGSPSKTAYVLVDLHLTEPGQSCYVDVDSFVDVAFALETDTSAVEKARLALLAAKSLRDTVLLSTETRRALQARDPISATTEAGDWVAYPL